MNPYTASAIARVRMAERHAEADRHRALRALRATRAAQRDAARDGDGGAWSRIRLRFLARAA